MHMHGSRSPMGYSPRSGSAMQRPQSVSPGPSRRYAPRMESSSPARFTPYTRSGAMSPMPSRQVNVPQSQNAADDSADAHASRDPHFSPDKQLARRIQAGIGSGESKRFGENCEFVSIGCFCAVAHALQSLGLKQYTYPFDWNRSPADGVIHCLQTNFVDFLDYGFVRDEGAKGKLFGGTVWGGSFWHHDITKPKVRADFQRRIERFYGRKEVAPDTTRVFVRAINSTSELTSVLDLQRVLQEVLPDAKIFLLILIDLQVSSGLMSLSGAAGDNILFAKVHESLFAQCTKHWSIEKHSNAYSEAIAHAVQWWSGDRNMSRGVAEFASLQDMFGVIDPFDGGSTKDQLFTPIRSGARPVAPTVSSAVKPAPLPIGRARLNTGHLARGDASPTMRSGDLSPGTPSQSPRPGGKPSLSPSRRRDPGSPGSCSSPVSPSAQSDKGSFSMEGSAKVTEHGTTKQSPSSPTMRSRVNSMTQKCSAPGSVRIAVPPKSSTKRVSSEVISQSSSKAEQMNCKTPSAPVGQATHRDSAISTSAKSTQRDAIETVTSSSANVKGTSAVLPPPSAKCDSRRGDLSPIAVGLNETLKPGAAVRSDPRSSDAGQGRVFRPGHSAGVGASGQAFGTQSPTVPNVSRANASVPRSSSFSSIGRSLPSQRMPGYHSPQHPGFSCRGGMGSSFYGSSRIP